MKDNGTILASWSIPRKLALLLLVVFLPAALVLIQSGFAHRGHAIREAENNALLLAQSLAAQQEQITLGTKQMLSTLALLPEVRGLDAVACNKLFRELHNRQPCYSIISAATPDGAMFASSVPFEPGSIDLSDRKHFREAIQTLDFSVGEYGVGRVTQAPTLHFSYPVLDADKGLVAVVSAGFMLNEYARFIAKVSLPEGSAVAITDHNGVRVFRLPESDAAAPGTPISRESFNRMSADADQGIYEKVAMDGVLRVYAFKRLRLKEGSPPYLYMIVGTPKATTVHLANLEMLRDLSVLGAAGLLAVCLAWVFANVLFIKPINRLVGAMQRFGKGELGARAGLAYTADELVQLARSFDDMAALLEVRDIERRRAEEALSQRESYLTAIIENLPGLVWLKDTEGRFLAINHAFARFWGKEGPDEIVGQIGLDIWPKELAERLSAVDKEVIVGGPSNAAEELVSIYGETKWLEIFKTVVLNSDGQVLGTCGYASDITERKHAEAMLRESDERFRSLLQSVPTVAVQGYAPDGTVLYWNEASARLYGFTAEEALGGNMLDLIVPPSMRQELEGAMRQLVNTGRPIPAGEMELRRKDGSLVPVFSSRAIIQLPGRGPEIYCMEIDLTERRRVEEALKESRQQLTDIINFLPDATLVIDKEGKVIAWNMAIEEMTGIKAEDMLGKGGYEYALPFYGERRPVLIDLVLDPQKAEGLKYARMERKETVLVGEAYMRALRGREVYLSATAGALLDSKGSIVGAIESVRDITDRKRAQEEKERLEAQLRHAHKMEAVGTLAGGIAHDFNNILAAVIGYAELALSEVPKLTPASDYLQQVLNAGHRAKDLVKQILAFSRMRQRQERVPVAIAPLIKEALNLLRASLPSTIEIRHQIHDEACVALADATEIHQVLVNLCTNAAQAMEESGGVLSVGLSEIVIDSGSVGFPEGLDNGRYLQLSVSDTGHGIDPAILERIFDPYFTTKEVSKGSGLGLAVAHGIVKRHEGAIDVRSLPGSGAVFRVYLPEIERRSASEAGAQVPIPKGTERVLFIDDEEPLTNLGRRMLERLGYSVQSKTNSLEALELFRSRPDDFDLVITDFTMPQMTGADLARELMRIRPDIPVIVCTGYTERLTEEKAREMHIRAFVLKPLNLHDMAHVIRSVLEKAHR